MKSTHSGHCQACGHLQKLPNGVMSLHGYNVTHGFFSGTCAGAKHLPFEQSCDLVKEFIASAKTQLANVEAQQAELRARRTTTAMVHNYETTAMVHNYEALPFSNKSSYVWREVTIQSETKSFGDGHGTYETFFYMAPGASRSVEIGTIVRHDERDYSSRSAVEVATKKNAMYADWLEHEADSLRRYIAWQTERVANWKPAPLLANDAKDKLGFKPTEPRY